MEIKAGPFLLRELESRDVDALFEAIRSSVKELSRWTWWAHEGYEISETRAFIESQEAIRGKTEDFALGIFEPDSGRILGVVGINEVDSAHRHCNLGYWMTTSATRQGIATTAALAVARYALSTLNMHRIEVVVAVDNEASLKVAERIGAVREGRLRNRLVVQGKPHDAYMHSLILSDLGRID